MARATWSPDDPAAAVIDPPAAPVIPDPEPTLSAPVEGEKPEDKKVEPVEAKEPKAEEPPAEGEKPEDKALEDKPEGAPEAYELKAPDGQNLDPAAVELATPIFKELGLTNDQAQKVTSLYAEQILPAVAQQVQGQTLELLGLGDIGKWRELAEKDPEFGGAKLTETLAMVAKARDQFASPALRELLEKSRLGNHPEWVRMMSKVGKAISEGTFERGDPAAKETKYLHQTLYGEEYQPKS